MKKINSRKAISDFLGDLIGIFLFIIIITIFTITLNLLSIGSDTESVYSSSVNKNNSFLFDEISSIINLNSNLYIKEEIENKYSNETEVIEKNLTYWELACLASQITPLDQKTSDYFQVYFIDNKDQEILVEYLFEHLANLTQEFIDSVYLIDDNKYYELCIDDEIRFIINNQEKNFNFGDNCKKKEENMVLRKIPINYRLTIPCINLQDNVNLEIELSLIQKER